MKFDRKVYLSLYLIELCFESLNLNHNGNQQTLIILEDSRIKLVKVIHSK